MLSWFRGSGLPYPSLLQLEAGQSSVYVQGRRVLSCSITGSDNYSTPWELLEDRCLCVTHTDPWTVLVLMVASRERRCETEPTGSSWDWSSSGAMW